MIPFQKIIAWFLIGLLSFEVTFRIPLLLPDASALESGDHEDIVSLLVEEDLFRRMSEDIDTYARRIQAQLPHTRTVVLTFAKDAHPYLVASANERLYFSGIPNHGQKTQKLVGTILIGRVPIPVVHKDGRDFLSLFPYTDFDEPHFFWNWDTLRYEFLGQKQKDTRPDIWHSVIDPNTGNAETDVNKIRDFFARVYEYDAKKGRYQNVGIDPQVLYMDSINESRAASKGLLSVYEQVSLPAQENLLYHRFTREYSQYLYSSFLSLMKSEGTEKIVPFREWKFDPNSSSSFLTKASDITTKVFADQLITPFIKVINEKYLGDLNRWVHNTGRYYNGYSDVRVDTIPELITTKDALASQILKEGNDSLEKLIDSYVDNNLSLDIPVLVNRPFQKTITETQNVGGKLRQVSRTYNFVYDNYFYGTKAGAITTASECSLIRGSTFGGLNSTVETNHGYNILGAQDDSKKITADVDAGIKCTSLTQSYWGGNSAMNASFINNELVLKNHRYDDFSLPILDLSAGKKTTGVNSPLDCFRNDLILRPYQHNGLNNRTYLWPVETGGSRYSCATPLQSSTPAPFSLDPTPETGGNILSSFASCSGTTGNMTLLNRTGASLGSCEINGSGGTYKRISSLVKHSDPSSEIYGLQLQGNSTPNLPVDEDRYLLYLDRTGSQARIDYPNLFDVLVNQNDTDDIIISKIRTALSISQSEIVASPALPTNSKWSQLIQSQTSTVTNLADVILTNSDIRAGLIDALRWKQLDVEMKYKKILETALTPTTTNNKLILPEKKNLYEISYLGGQGDARNFVFGFSPEQKTDLPEWFTKIQSAQGDIQTTLGTFSSDLNPEYSLSAGEIGALLGASSGSSPENGDNASGEGEKDSSSDKCGDPNGVVIWEWLSAIQCWLSNLIKTEWFKPNIDDIGFPELLSLTLNLNGRIIWSTKELKNVEQVDRNSNGVLDYVDKNKDSLTLRNTLSSDTLEPSQTLRIDSSLEDETYRINDDTSTIQLVVTRIDDLDEKKSYSARDKDWADIQNRYFKVSGSPTMTDGHVMWIFTSKNNHRARISFESRMYSGSDIFLRSEKNSILMGPASLRVTVLGSSGSLASQSIVAGDSQGVNMVLSEMDTYPSTVDITIRNYVTGEEVGIFKSVPVVNGRVRIGSPAIDSIIKKTGRYSVSLIAGDFLGKTYFNIIAAQPDRLAVTFPNILIKDFSDNLSVILQDAWGNPIDASNWSMSVKSTSNISLLPLSSDIGNSFSGKATTSLNLIPKESGNTTLTITFFQNDTKIISTVSRPVLTDAHLIVDVANKDTIEVGKNTTLNFSIQRKDGSLVDNWDIPLEIGVRGGDAKITSNILNFSGGKSETVLQSGTRPGTVSLYIKNSGLGQIVGDSFNILPGTPTQISLSSPETLYARENARDLLRIRIYDTYGNLTNLHGYTLGIDVDKNDILQPILAPREVAVGTFETEIVSRGNPGRILFRTWLEKNGKKSDIVSLENVSETNTLPVITSEDAAQNNWQNLTQVLLGAAFGQTPIQGYFGGAALFAPLTKTLALSTLIDTPENPIITVLPTGNIDLGTLQYGTGVEVKIESYFDKALTLLVYDTRLGNIARIRYPIMSDISFISCVGTCNKDALSFSPASIDIVYRDGSVYKNSQKLFSLSEIFSFPNLSFGFIDQPGKSLQFSVSYSGTLLGTVSLQWKPRVPAQSYSNISDSTYRIEPLRGTLSTKLAWSDMSSHDTPSMVLYAPETSSSYLGGAHKQGWSSYPKETGLGWTGDNTSLLQFAAGEEWGSAQRNNQDYLTINLGDPLIRLPNYQVNTITGLDKTLGEPVYMSGLDIDDFTFRDTNSDGKKDLIVYHLDGTVGMALARTDGTMLDIGDLLTVRDAEKGMVRSGDFIGDGYADIVYVDSQGSLRQATHDINGPIETPMKYDTTPLLGQIDQLEVFDMDYDGIDDIIVMDNLGSLFIFYGHSSGIFRVQLIDNVYDFVLSDEAKSSYFTGAIRYSGLGFVDTTSLPKSANFEFQSKRDQVNQTLFTQIRIAQGVAKDAPKTLGTTVTNTITGDQNGFLRMYDGDATTLSNSLQFGYDSLASESESTITILAGDETKFDTYNLLKAPFIIPGYLSVTKQYKSLEASGQILAGSPVEVKIVLKNVSKKNINDIILLERFADYLSVDKMEYEIIQGAKKETRTFIIDSSQSNSGIADMSGITLSPGSSIELVYTGSLRSFSFGRFDVGYLEDKNDPLTSEAIPQDKIKTINPTAAKLTSISERDFYNHDVYGDIRFNPNETCGGPLLLWRSHNTFDKTYHKTIIARDIPDPDKNASTLSEDPTRALDPSGSAYAPPFSSEILKNSQSALVEWQTDSDGDNIPDKDDDDHGDMFEVSSSGNQTQISVSLGKVDDAIDDIVKGVQDVISGLSCGFGDPGCISMPINWAANIPGNTVTALGYALPLANQPPIACHNDVRCGYPVFAYPTICSTTGYPTCTWPSHPTGAGGAFDYYGGSSVTGGNGLNDGPNAAGVVSPLGVGAYMPGLGISQYRLFIGATLTGAIAEVFCFGPNNAISNLPGMFPLRFDGNCVFATQPLFQCSDDGSGDEPLVIELDVSTSLSDDIGGDDENGGGNGNIYTNADNCGFFEPLDAYPTNLSEATSAYFSQTNDTTASTLQASISSHASLINNTSGDTALGFSTVAPSTTYERLNGQNGLKYQSIGGSGMIQISLNPEAMKFRDFGRVLDINLTSIKGFPNFVMDWYQRQMDEIMSSLTNLPDLKIYLPDLTSLADKGWISGFGKGMKDKLGDIVSAPVNNGTPQGTNNDYYNAQDKNNNCGATACSIAASKLTGANAQQLEEKFTAEDPGGMSWSSPSTWLKPLGLNVGQRDNLTPTQIDAEINRGNEVVASVTPKSGLTNGGHIIALTGSQKTGSAYVYENSDPNVHNINRGLGTITDSQISNGGAKQFWVVSNNGSTSNSGNILTKTADTVSSGWNRAFDGVGAGLDTVNSGVSTVFGGVENSVGAVGSVVQQKTAGIQNAFEYLGTLPIINIRPESINFEIPWVGKQEAQSWIIRNQAILDAWQSLPSTTENIVNFGPFISSIQSNIETVKTYLELPERLQTLFYLKEKLLFGIVQNVQAVQNLMGGWLYNNGLRFRGWVEAFILITKLFDLWQVLLDVFNDYEVECGECRNERWNLQHWLWIIISAIIPPIPVIQMPRWPDIELDFSDIDLSLDIAYPVFNLSFYPIHLPDAPTPSISGFAFDPMPQFPRLPNLNIDINIPVIQLPQLPDLPPPPLIPELSQAITVVLKIFKLLVLIQCLYRKIPLSPEWFVGTKVAHKTERQGYLPFDFLDSLLPTVTMDWLEAIRVSSHVRLNYNVDFIVEQLRDALEPFTNFPRNMDRLSSGSPKPFHIDVNPDTGIQIQTSSTEISPDSLVQIPDLIRSLFAATTDVKMVDPSTAISQFSEMIQGIDIRPERRAQLAGLMDMSLPSQVDISPVQEKMNHRFDQIASAVNTDISENSQILADLAAWSQGLKKPEEIAFIAQDLPGTSHLARAQNTASKLLALSPSILNPTAIVSSQLAPFAAPLAVAPTPEAAVAPSNQTIFQNMVEDTKISKTRGLYVSRGTTTQRLIDYTENLDGSTKIHTLDDDGDGDLEVYYSLGNVIYRKENHTKTPSRYIIKDAPKVFTTNDIYEDFFGIKGNILAAIPSNGQIDILQNHSANRIRYQSLMKNGNEHMKLRLSRSLFETRPEKSRYQVDIIPKPLSDTNTLSISSVPYIEDIDGLVFIEHNKIYRTLLTRSEFINEQGKIESLSSDFVIRSGQSGYTTESTTLDIIRNGKTTTYKVAPSQRVRFDADSRVAVKKGSLILFGNTTEKRPLTIRDTNMPLLPGDLLITDKNGGATLSFSDGTRTNLGSSQYWTLTEYVPGVGIKKLSLPVEAEWYYGTIVDARTLAENILPHATVFDAYTDFTNSDIISQIPRQITLSLPSPTEIDFQSYFPADTLTNIEIFRLPSSRYRRVSATKIAFDTQKENTEILVRVTAGSRVRDYTTTIATTPPRLSIDTLSPEGGMTGNIFSASNSLPLGIQTYIDASTWPLASGFSSNANNAFSTSVVRTSAKISINQGPTRVATFDRSSSLPSIEADTSLRPIIQIGKPFAYSLTQSGAERLTVQYDFPVIQYRQVASLAEIQSNGMYVLGAGLRLELPTINDKNLPGGAYITDTAYRPLVTLDSRGIVRTLDTNVSWKTQVEGNRIVFVLSKDGKELGKIILSGDMVTNWVGK